MQAVKKWQSRFRYYTLHNRPSHTWGTMENWKPCDTGKKAKGDRKAWEAFREARPRQQMHNSTNLRETMYPFQVLSLFCFSSFFVCKGMLQVRFSVLSWLIDPLASWQNHFQTWNMFITFPKSHQEPRRSTGRRPILSASSAKTGPAKAWTKSFMATSRPSRACATERTWRFQSSGACQKKHKQNIF